MAPPSAQERFGAEGPLDRPAMARTLGLFYLSGGLLGLVAIATEVRPEADVPAMLAVTAVTFACAAALYAGAKHMPRGGAPAALALGTLLISAGVYFDGHASSVGGLFYVWVGVLAFYFFDRTKALPQLIFIGACFAAVMSQLPAQVPLQRWLVTVGTVAFGGLVVSYMRDRITELVAHLTDAARTDPLTGLLNRRALEELFETELERSRRTGRPLSVIVGDLDGFKAVNDRLGHHAGDRALQQVARELNKWKRRMDMAARMGGEEFALLLPETDERGAFLVAERLRRATQRCFGDVQPLPLTISFGVASFPDHGDEAEMLLHSADRALYAAKDLGKDRTVIYSAEVAQMLSADGDTDLSDLQLATVISLAEALDIRDTGTAAHSQAVGRYVHMTAEELGFDPDHAERVRLAGVLHDVGKIGLSDGLLAKPGPLDDDEWREMRTHPEIACRLLARREFDDLRSWIVSHHERVDGSGYPLGLAGEDIPLEARIIAVADAYEAMTADRVYRPALGEQAARVELIAGSGAQFDGAVVEAFLSALDKHEERRLALPEPTVTK